MSKIFCASTGRSGTKFAAWVFRTYTDVPAFHEPDPKLCGPDAEEINAGNITEGTQERIDQKFKFIEDNTKDGQYFEGSNMWVKSWANLAMERWPGDVGIFRLRRDLAGYLISSTRRGKRGEKGRFHSAFLLDPTAKGNALQGYPGMSFYETVAWNYFEVEARYRKARETARRIYEMDFKDIGITRAWAHLFDTFEIQHRLPAHFPETPDRHQSIFDDKGRIACLDHLQQNWSEPRAPIDAKTWLKLKGESK